MDIQKYDFSVSARSKPESMPIDYYLSKYFSIYPISSVFGFTEYCPLYGGRKFIKPELSDEDISWLYNNNIGYRIPLQNTIADINHYKDSKSFLSKYYREGNSVIIAQDWLVPYIREDFPLYKIEGSVIRKSLDYTLYDTIVPDMALPLEAISNLPKDRIRLFINAWCAYDCPKRPCWKVFSALNLGLTAGDYICKGTHVERKFDLEKYKILGYTKFKVLRGT